MRHIASRRVSGFLAVALAGAMALPALPAAAASATKAPGISTDPVVATTTDFSARRRHYRGNNGAAALAAFGMIAGTIATIAANERRRDYYERGYGYYGGGYGYAPRPYYGPRFGNPGYRYW